jgi:Kef-type K+ transport system membrane component KefB
LSQVGLVLFMFLVGLELNPQTLRERGHTAVVTSHASIIAPFLLGALLALYLYPRLSDDSVTFTQFALFIGTALSITAFPVLARILTERNLLRTHLGTVAIACAAVDDVTAWCILAGVVLLIRSTQLTVPLWLTLVGTIGYVATMVFVIRPILRRMQRSRRGRVNISQNYLALILLVLLGSAWVTEWVGIHAFFGAFLAGVIMPKDRQFVHLMAGKLQDMSVVLLVPLFFAFTGLRASIGLLSSVEMWFYCGLIIAVAILGKFGGSTLAARLTGMQWREAGALGVLMNTRGLVELVVLNIGLDIGVISPALFTMMVMMALVTTFMTTPLLHWVYLNPLRRQQLAITELTPAS